ncbi:MAG: hypothetical protein WD467_02080 [Candidatus Saccharimonadales bacterium]
MDKSKRGQMFSEALSRHAQNERQAEAEHMKRLREIEARQDTIELAKLAAFKLRRDNIPTNMVGRLEKRLPRILSSKTRVEITNIRGWGFLHSEASSSEGPSIFQGYIITPDGQVYNYGGYGGVPDVYLRYTDSKPPDAAGVEAVIQQGIIDMLVEKGITDLGD